MGLYLTDWLCMVVALALVIIVMLQSSKDDIKDAFSGEKSELFKNQKARGAELFLQRLTAVLAIGFVVLVVISCAIDRF